MRTQDVSRHSVIQENQHELEKLKLEHSKHLEKIKHIHQKEIDRTKQGNRVELESLKDQNQQQIAKQIQKNEEVLEGIKHSLDITKKTTDAELEMIQEQKRKKIDNIEARFKSDYNARLEGQKEKLSELEHESSIELDRIKRANERTMYEIRTENRGMESDAILEGKDKLELTKNEFNRRYNNKQSQYYRALTNQEQNYKKRLSGLENKYQDRLNTREAQAQKKLSHIEKVENNKQQTQIKNFEERYQMTFQKNEKLLQELMSKKEKLMEKFNHDLFESYQVNSKKAQDAFYQNGQITSHLTETHDGYELKIPVAEHEKDKVNFVAQGKELKVTMTRDFEHNSKEAGKENYIKKVESYISRIPIEHFIDPKTVSSSYQEGNLIFRVKKA